MWLRASRCTLRRLRRLSPCAAMPVMCNPRNKIRPARSSGGNRGEGDSGITRRRVSA